jgi:hypothetical protein
MEILHHLYTESEAMVGGKFPMAPMKLEEIVSSTGIQKDELENTLQSMIHKGLVLNIPTSDGTIYMLSPMMVGFFEYTFLRRNKPDYVEIKNWQNNSTDISITLRFEVSCTGAILNNSVHWYMKT